MATAPRAPLVTLGFFMLLVCRGCSGASFLTGPFQPGPDAAQLSCSLFPAKAEKFLLGVNVPWGDYGWDFDEHYLWGGKNRSAYWRTTFEQLRWSGATTARVFLFCDGRASPKFDDVGDPLPLTDLFYQNLDDLVRSAELFSMLRVGPASEGIRPTSQSRK